MEDQAATQLPSVTQEVSHPSESPYGNSSGVNVNTENSPTITPKRKSLKDMHEKKVKKGRRSHSSRRSSSSSASQSSRLSFSSLSSDGEVDSPHRSPSPNFSQKEGEGVQELQDPSDEEVESSHHLSSTQVDPTAEGVDNQEESGEERDGDILNDSSETSLEEGVFKAEGGSFIPHSGPWYRLNEERASLVAHPDFGEVLHYKDRYITPNLYLKRTGPMGVLISPKGELGANSKTLSSLLSECHPFIPGDKARETDRRMKIAADLFGFLHDSDYFANQLGWHKVPNRDEVELKQAPSWIQEYAEKDFKFKPTDLIPSWNFVDAEGSHILETLSDKMDLGFMKDGSRLADAWARVPEKDLADLDAKRKSALSSSRVLIILDCLKKIMQASAAPDPSLTRESYQALFQRCLALTDEVSRHIELGVKSDISKFAKARREARETFIGEMKPSSLR